VAAVGEKVAVIMGVDIGAAAGGEIVVAVEVVVVV
jgi:hypothetical protein